MTHPAHIRAAVVEAVRAGKTPSSQARRHDLPASTVSKWLRQAGLTKERRAASGVTRLVTVSSVGSSRRLTISLPDWWPDSDAIEVTLFRHARNDVEGWVRPAGGR